MTLILSGTDGLSDVDGSAATPAIRGTDANTGIFFPSADVIAFSEGGVEAMRMDANGDLLAGTTDTSFFSGSNRGVGLYGSNGFIAASRSNAISGLFNRFGSDGEVIQLRRNGTSVGTLGVSATGVTMTGTNGITFTATQTASADANTLDDYEEGTWTPNVGGSATYFTQLGSYVKVGRAVTASFDLTVNSIGSGAANSVAGLPFPAGGIAPGQAGSVSYWSGALNGVAWFSIRVDLTSTTLTIAGSAATNTTTAAASINLFQNGARLIGTITYIAAS
jgi:hypothetical protein